MNLVIGLVVGGLFLAILEMRHQGIVATLSSYPVTPPAPVIPPNAIQGQTMVGGSVVDNLIMHNVSAALGQIPVVGPFFQSVLGAFTQASQQRAREATSENQAVDAFIVRGFDPGIVQVVNGYNRAQLSAAEAVNLLDQLWKNFWAEVSSQIQPGRNGCQNGAAIDYSPAHPPTISASQSCGGSWGAACCVATQVIGSSIGRLQQAIIYVDSNGGSKTVVISKVFPSKYSNFSRPAYSVTVQKS